MAGDWLKWVKGLAKKPEVLHMAGELGRPRHEIAGRLMEVWEWADDNAVLDSTSISVSGICPGVVRLPSVSTSLIDDLAGISGFADSMSSVGWIDIRTGRIVFPNFSRHNGNLAKSRALDAERKRTKRSGKSSDSPKPVPDLSASSPDKTRTREEKRREEKIPLADKPPRKRNDVFDAIAVLTGLDPSVKANGGLLGKVSASLSGADPPYTSEDIKEFGRRFWDLCPYAAKDNRERPTAPEVEKYIGLLRAAPAPHQKPKGQQIVTDPDWTMQT